MEKTKRIFSILIVLCMLVGTIGVLPLTAFAANEVKITPSATGGTYDENTNTLTVVGGGKVFFEPSNGIEFESVEGTKQPKDGEDTTIDDNVSATLDGTKWVATLPNEDAEYIFRGYYNDTNDDFTLTECTVVIKYGLRAPTNLRWDTSNGAVATWDAVDGATHYKVELYKKDIISLRLISHVISDTSFDFDLTSLLPGSYYFTVRATCDDIKSESATSDDIIITSGGTPITIGGENKTIDYIDGTAFIVGRDDIANGSISEIDMTPTTGTASFTEEQAAGLVEELLSLVGGMEYETMVSERLEQYSLADLKLMMDMLHKNYIYHPNMFKLVLFLDEEIEAREATTLVIAPGYIDSNTDKFTVNFGGTQAEMNNDALQKILDNLGDGDNVKISVKDVGAEVLPKTLTEKGPYGGSEAAIDKSIFKAAGIENIEDRLKTLGLINGNTDSSVTEDEFEYLYHYLTTDELTALKNELNESAHFEHHQNAVNWLTKMIERDRALVTLNTGHLDESGIRSKLEAVGYTGSDLTLGLLRQADLDMEQLQYIKNLMQEFIEAFDDDADELILAWANEAIAQKELEKENATITSMTLNGLKEYADLTDKQMKILSDMGLQNLDNPSVGQIKKLDLTLEQMELLYAEIDRARSAEYNPEYQAEYDVLLKWLEKAIAEKEQENTDTPTYINTDGTNDGINPIFIGAVDVNIGAVKVDGTTTPIAIKADRSDAVAWSTNIGSAALEEMLAMLGAATTGDVVSNIKAYKVLDNGTLEAKASKVTVNADGTLTLSAMSDGNSTYVFLYEPAKASEEHTHSFEWVIDKEATETEDGVKHEECACGAKQNENTVIPKTGTTEPNGLSTGAIAAIVIACVVVLVGGGFALYLFVFKKRKEEDI